MPSLSTDPATDRLQPPVVVCIDCDATVFDWSTPHPDRCWECAEAADLEADR